MVSKIRNPSLSTAEWSLDLGVFLSCRKGTNLSLVNKWADVEPGKASFDHRSLMNTVVKREGNRPIMMIGPKVPPVQVQ